MSDLIDRAAAIDAMTNTLWHYPNECYRNLNEYEFAKGLSELGLKSVPPAEPNCSEIPNNSDCISRQAAIDTEGLNEEIRCEMCRNPIHTNRGCDGNCRYDEKLYKKIIQILDKRIKPLPSAQPYSEADIQKMQDLEQAELQKAYECGRASAQPERKTGKWSVEFSPAYKGGAYCECSQCNYKFAMGAYFEPDEWKFCPKCGADMRGEQDG